MRLVPVKVSCLGVVVAVSLALVACGGRVARPVDSTTAIDDQLSCDHLRAEQQVNDARIADLKDEKSGATNNNVAGVVTGGAAGVLMLDVSGSETKEISALRERNKVLDGLIAKKCQASSAASGN
jgi:hypothetical protein